MQNFETKTKQKQKKQRFGNWSRHQSSCGNIVFFWFAPIERKKEVASQSASLRRTKHCEDDNFTVRVRRLCSSGWMIFVVRVGQQTADIGCLVYQMLRPTYTGCCERKKKHETIHSIKATYPQNVVFLVLTTPLSVFQMCHDE